MPATVGLISRDGKTAIVPVEQVVKNDAARPVAAGALGRCVNKLHLAPGAQAKVTGEWAVPLQPLTNSKGPLHVPRIYLHRRRRRYEEAA
jgi:hypothetical protein